MSPLLKFWISSTLLLFVLSIWPLTQLETNGDAHSEQELSREAKLVDHFCLSQNPTGGRTSNPKAWETILGAEIKLRESVGEAAGDAGYPRDQSGQLTSLKPGEGLLHTDQNSVHYVLRSGQGKDWYLVLTKKKTTGIALPRSGQGAAPSPVAIAIAFALISGGLLTLLARVAFGTPAKSE